MATQPQVGAAPLAVFVGRRQELGALETELENVRAGRSRVVLVEGAAGIGKTALIERFLAPLDDVTVLRASGDESERDLPFGVLEQLLPPRRRAPARSTAITSPPARSCSSCSARSSDEHPIAVVIDDAHWADAMSLRALLFVVRRLVADRVLIVIATREDADAARGPGEGGRERRPPARPAPVHARRAARAGRGRRRAPDRARRAPPAGARRRQPAVLARAAGRAARRRLAPPGQPPRPALVRRDRQAPGGRLLARRRRAARGRRDPRPARPAGDRRRAGRRRRRRSTRSRRPVPRACCGSTRPAACPRPRSRTR